MADPIPVLEEAALAKGCKMNEHGRLCFPRALVEDVIAHAGQAINWCGQDERYDLDLSGMRVHTYGGGEAVNALDVGADEYRPSTILDVYDFARLVDRMDNIHAFSRLVVATEIEDLRVCDINTAYASVAGTQKHTALTFAYAEHVEPTLEMLYMVAIVTDNDMLGNVLRTVRGIEINEATLSYEIIDEVVHGEGHFLRQPQTLELMRSEYAYPEVADRGTHKEWEEVGSPTMRQRAGEKAREILSTHYPEYIPSEVVRKIREKFPIVLSAEDMRPGNGRW